MIKKYEVSEIDCAVCAGKIEVFNYDWSYTIKRPANQDWAWLWIKEETTYTPNKSPKNGWVSLAKANWAGWVPSNVELMNNILTDDWYLKYGYGIANFDGAEISPSEKRMYMEKFDIKPSETTEELMNNLNFAFDSIGRIAYYPGDRAEYPEYDERNNFYTSAPEIIIERRDSKGQLKGTYALATHGLDSKYYADWVYMSTHEGRKNDILRADTHNFHTCSFKVTSSTLPGTPIVKHGSNAQTGILIGVEGNRITYIGINENGWVSVITSSEAFYTSDKLVETE